MIIEGGRRTENRRRGEFKVVRKTRGEVKERGGE